MEIKTKDGRVMSLSKTDSTITIDGSEIEASEAERLQYFLRIFLNEIGHEQRMVELKRAKELREEKQAQKQASRERTLQAFRKKISGKPFQLIETPPTRFGTTMDGKHRVIAVGAPDENGSRVAIIWTGGERWSDNGGSHYGESSLDIDDVKIVEENGKQVLRRSPHYLKRVKLPNIPETKELRHLFRGGQISPSRLEKLMPIIKYLIPDFEPLLPPRGYTLIYNEQPVKAE